MSLHLDTRQRAMLQEMGVRIWSPKPTAPLPESAASPVHSAAPRPAPSPPVAPKAATPPPATAPTAAAQAWTLQAPQPLYPNAPAPVDTDTSSCWLLLAEGVADTDPLASEAGVLLDNMLHALRLRQQPRVFISRLIPPPTALTDHTDHANTTSTATAAPCAPALAQAIAQVQPAVLLVMGRAAARHLLGRSEPLGQLRAQTHSASGIPAVVTYDPAYLLRAPHAKAAAWDDLCRARALALAPLGSAAPVNS